MEEQEIFLDQDNKRVKETIGTGNGTDTTFNFILTNLPYINNSLYKLIITDSGGTETEYSLSTTDNATEIITGGDLTTGSQLVRSSGALTLVFNTAIASGSTIEVEYYQYTSDSRILDEIPIWTLDSGLDDILTAIYSITIGQGLGSEVAPERNNLEIPLYTELIISSRKFMIDNKYVIDVVLQPTPDIEWVSEIGLFTSTDDLLYYAKFPRLNKIDGYNFAFRIEIEKL